MIPSRHCSGGVVVHGCLVYLAVFLCTSDISALPISSLNPTSKGLERHMVFNYLPLSH